GRVGSMAGGSAATGSLWKPSGKRKCLALSCGESGFGASAAFGILPPWAAWLSSSAARAVSNRRAVSFLVISSGKRGQGKRVTQKTPLFSRPHDVLLGAVHYGEEFRTLGLGHLKLVKCLPEIIEERLPLPFRDVQVGMGIKHGLARVALRPSGCCTDLFGHEIFEPR